MQLRADFKVYDVGYGNAVDFVTMTGMEDNRSERDFFNSISESRNVYVEKIEFYFFDCENPYEKIDSIKILPLPDIDFKALVNCIIDVVNLDTELAKEFFIILESQSYDLLDAWNIYNRGKFIIHYGMDTKDLSKFTQTSKGLVELL